MSYPPPSYTDHFNRIERELKEINKNLGQVKEFGAQIKEFHQEIKSLRFAFTHFYAEELVQHVAEIKEYEREIQALRIDNSMLELQAESTVSSLKAQIHRLHSRYQGEILSLTAMLKLRIYQYEAIHDDPNVQTKINDLIDAVKALTQTSQQVMQIDPNSPIRTKTAPVSPRRTSSTTEFLKLGLAPEIKYDIATLSK